MKKTKIAEAQKAQRYFTLGLTHPRLERGRVLQTQIGLVSQHHRSAWWSTDHKKEVDEHERDEQWRH